MFQLSRAIPSTLVQMRVIFSAVLRCKTHLVSSVLETVEAKTETCARCGAAYSRRFTHLILCVWARATSGTLPRRRRRSDWTRGRARCPVRPDPTTRCPSPTLCAAPSARVVPPGCALKRETKLVRLFSVKAVRSRARFLSGISPARGERDWENDILDTPYVFGCQLFWRRRTASVLPFTSPKNKVQVITKVRQ